MLVSASTVVVEIQFPKRHNRDTEFNCGDENQKNNIAEYCKEKKILKIVTGFIRLNKGKKPII